MKTLPRTTMLLAGLALIFSAYASTTLDMTWRDPPTRGGPGAGEPGRGEQEPTHARRLAGCSQQGAVRRHRLGGVLDTTSRAESTMRAQRVVALAMTAGRTAYPLRIPFDDGIEQAHAALMRQVGQQPSTI